MSTLQPLTGSGLNQASTALCAAAWLSSPHLTSRSAQLSSAQLSSAQVRSGQVKRGAYLLTFACLRRSAFLARACAAPVGPPPMCIKICHHIAFIAAGKQQDWFQHLQLGAKRRIKVTRLHAVANLQVLAAMGRFPIWAI